MGMVISAPCSICMQCQDVKIKNSASCWLRDEGAAIKCGPGGCTTRALQSRVEPWHAGLQWGCGERASYRGDMPPVFHMRLRSGGNERRLNRLHRHLACHCCSTRDHPVFVK